MANLNSINQLTNHILVEFLLNHGANTELKDSDGRTALHVAAWQGYTDIVQVLLLNGADVNSVDSGNR